MQNFKSKVKIKPKLNKTFYFLIVFLIFEFLFLNLGRAAAETMTNKDYILKTEGLNSISGVASGTDTKIQSTVGSLSPIVSEGVNFKVKTGFENIMSELPFSVTLSSDIIDYGSLTPTNPIIRTVDLEVYSLSLYGYSVVTSENHSLSGEKGSISDTTCDDGTCNQEQAAVWTNTFTYGFGYRCDNVVGVICDKSFLNAEGILSGKNFYKSFANSSNGDLPKALVSGVGSKNKSTRLSYKVNVSGNQAQDIYTNIITFIAIPNF